MKTRYTSSPESTIESDLNRISSLAPGDKSGFASELDRIVNSNFTGDYWDISFPNRLDSSSASSPVLLAYWAALNLLDAELLFSRMKVRDLLDPAVTAPRSIERHHLFPKAFLATRGVTSRTRVNAIANMAFLDWPENAKIGPGDPRQYWPTLTEGMDPARLEQQRSHHALPIGWEQLDYAEFLERRRSLIARVTREGFQLLWSDHAKPAVAASLIEQVRMGESQTMEFKSTARVNLHTRQVDKKMEHVIGLFIIQGVVGV